MTVITEFAPIFGPSTTLITVHLEQSQRSKSTYRGIVAHRRT
jgi:hypothetical protein